MEIAERFINYTKFDTQSADESETVPSTAKQLVFAKYLKEELEREGLKEVEMDEKGYIYATLPATTTKKQPSMQVVLTLRHALSGTTMVAIYNLTKIWFRRLNSSQSC